MLDMDTWFRNQQSYAHKEYMLFNTEPHFCTLTWTGLGIMSTGKEWNHVYRFRHYDILAQTLCYLCFPPHPPAMPLRRVLRHSLLIRLGNLVQNALACQIHIILAWLRMHSIVCTSHPTVFPLGNREPQKNTRKNNNKTTFSHNIATTSQQHGTDII